MLRYWFFILLAGSCVASELDDAVNLKNEAMAIFRANAGKAVVPEVYAQGIRKLEAAEKLLEVAVKKDPEKAEALQTEIASARFWAQRFANVQVAEALKPDAKPSEKPAETKPAPPVPEAAEPRKSVAESAANAAEAIDKSAAQLMKEGKHAEAAAKLQETLQKSAGANAGKLSELADYFYSIGQYKMALEYCKLVVKDTEKRLGANDPFLALDLNRLALAYYEVQNYAEAEKQYQKVLAIRQKAYGAEHLEIAQTMVEIGKCNIWNVKYEQAETWLKRGLAMQEKLLKPDAPETADTHRFLGRLHDEASRFPQAEAELRKALEITERAYGANDSRLGLKLTNLANFLSLKRGQIDEARQLLNRALPLIENSSGATHPMMGHAYFAFGIMYSVQAKYSFSQESQDFYQKALTIYENANPDSADAAVTLLNLGVNALRNKEYDKADTLYSKAQAIYSKLYGEDSPKADVAPPVVAAPPPPQAAPAAP